MKFLYRFVSLLAALIITGCAAKSTPDVQATVAAAIAATKAAEPTQTPTPAPTATDTPGPTATITPSPSPTPSPTVMPTLTPEGYTSVLTETLDTGWTLYKLLDEGYSIELPADWKRIDLSPQALDSALSSVGEYNPNLKALFSSESLRQQARSGMKLFALDVSTRSLAGSSPVTMNVLKTNLQVDVPVDTYVEILIPSLQKTYNTTITHKAAKVGELDSQVLSYSLTLKTLTGATTTNKVVQYIALDGKLAYVTSFSSPSSLAGVYASIFDQIGQSFRLLK